MLATLPLETMTLEEKFITIETVWEDIMTEIGTRTTDMHIAKLRSKIEKDTSEPKIIKTVRGAGYKYESMS